MKSRIALILLLPVQLLAARLEAQQRSVSSANDRVPIEYRWFMAANEAQLRSTRPGYGLIDSTYAPDLVHRWSTALGEPTSNTEWRIGFDEIQDGYVLRGLDPQPIDPADTLHTTFLYRLSQDASELAARPLFAIEYRLISERGSGALDTTLLDTATITESAFRSAMDDAGTPDHKNLRIFPNTVYYPHSPRVVPQRYALLAKQLVLPRPTEASRKSWLDVSVRKYVPVDLYVRGLRVRNGAAERLMALDTVRSSSDGSDAAQILRSYGFTLPITATEFHAAAHLDAGYAHSHRAHLLAPALISRDIPLTWQQAMYADETLEPLPASFGTHSPYRQNRP